MAKKKKAGAKASKRKAQAVAKPAALDLAVLASDSKDASGFGNLDLSRDIAIPYINIPQLLQPQSEPTFPHSKPTKKTSARLLPL